MVATETCYSEKDDKTFIFDVLYDYNENPVKETLTGWYWGQPNEENTKKFHDRLEATYLESVCVDDYLDLDFVYVYTMNGVKMIMVYGYYYKSDDLYHYNSYGTGFNMTLAQYLSEDFNYDEHQCNVKQWIQNLTEDEIREEIYGQLVWGYRKAKITPDIEDGYYIEVAR